MISTLEVSGNLGLEITAWDRTIPGFTLFRLSYVNKKSVLDLEKSQTISVIFLLVQGNTLNSLGVTEFSLIYIFTYMCVCMYRE